MATSRTREKLVVALTEVMPGEARVAGISLAFSHATALLGGFTPAVYNCRTQVMHDWAASGYWQGFRCGSRPFVRKPGLYRRGAARNASASASASASA
ncbi:hypothetical protein DWU95_28680 [Burkholderia contaminans]|nr:hypothetical protein DWU95_28680 [Burkholderia contaminans]